MVRCVLNNIMEKLSGLISARQHGFQSGKSCITNLLESLDTIGSLLNRGSQISSVYLDMSKAFDEARHDLSLHKLQEAAFGKKGKKKKNDTKSKRYRYVGGLDVETIINLSLAVKRSCHWAEGITQRDPVAISLFVLSVQPMITCLQVASTAKQCRFLNDAGGTGYITEMRW